MRSQSSSIRAVSQLLRPSEDREVCFSGHQAHGQGVLPHSEIRMLISFSLHVEADVLVECASPPVVTVMVKS